MGRPPKKRIEYEMQFHDTKEWYDDMTTLTTGVSFIWKLTSPDAPAESEFYYIADLHLPPKPGKHVKNATAVWVSGEGIIMANTKEGAEWWKNQLHSQVGIDARDPYKRGTASTLSKLFSYDVYFLNEDKKELVRDVSTKSKEDFVGDFEEDMQKLFKADKIHHFSGYSTAEIYNMIPFDKIIDAYEKLSNILGILMGEEPEKEEEEAEEELPELGGETEREPTDEELAELEAKEKK